MTPQRHRTRPVRSGFALALVTLVPPASHAAAQLPPIIPIQHFFDSPEVASAQISPDGRWLAYLKPYHNKLNVFVRELGSGAERRMTADTTRPIREYHWSADGKRVLYLQDRGGNENFHIFAIPVNAPDPDKARDLTPYDSARAFVADIPRDLPDRIFIALNRRDPTAFDAYWLDLDSGALTLVEKNPGRFGAYLLDRQHVVRAAVAQGPAGENEIYASGDSANPWKLLASYPATETVNPLRLSPDGKSLYLTSDHGETQFARLIRLDLASGAELVVGSDPRNAADVSDVLFGAGTDSLLWIAYEADTTRIYPTEPAVARDLSRIRHLHDGTPSVTSMTRDEQRWVVAFDSPTDPAATYLYDRRTSRARFLFRPRPWLKPAELAGMKPVAFPARDGLTVHGYLTVPKGIPARKLPLVLLVHGGPWARDSWGYDPETQLLANRGYAVLQVNYRGSTGYGKAFYNAAVHQFSGTMHADLIDGVNWVVAQGIADPEKLCIYGGSYGGYATLVGVTFTPTTFRCAVDYVGPSSLITLIESFPPYWRPFMEGSWFRFVGDPAKPAERNDLWSRSPLSRVDQIRTPLMIVQGANDPRVTKREADQLAAALRDRGVKVQYIVAPNEGHGFLNPDNRLVLYRSMELFFGSYLGGRVQAEPPPGVEARLKAMTVDVDTLKVPPTVTAPAPATAPGR
jgi:dipeptidyl aminopeptidase/acylaminoacyl peptidase